MTRSPAYDDLSSAKAWAVMDQPWHISESLARGLAIIARYSGQRVPFEDYGFIGSVNSGMMVP